MTKNDVINGIFVNDGVSLEQKLRDKHKDILPAIDTRYTLTVVFAPNRAQVLMVLHNKQHMLYCELFEETGITKDDIDLKFVQSEHCIASFANPEWYLYVTTGVLKHDVEFKEEKNSLHWVFVTDDHVLLHDTFGNGNCFVFMQRALLALEDE